VVNEITPSGEVVHLTNLAVPVDPPDVKMYMSKTYRLHCLRVSTEIHVTQLVELIGDTAVSEITALASGTRTDSVVLDVYIPNWFHEM